MQENSALGRAMAMVRDLRNRCAWDRAQTRESLRPYLVEEVLEVDQALGDADPVRIRDEMSDFLLHLAWQLVLGGGTWRVQRRMMSPTTWWPRCGAAILTSSTSGPAEPWERLKRRERRRTARSPGLPPTLPPLLRAFRLQERAASVGFDWDDVTGPLAKVREELGEVEEQLPRRGPAGQRVSGAVPRASATGHRE